MVSGFTNSRYPTTSRGPHFNQFEQQEQDADEQKKTTDAIRLAMLAHQFENIKAEYYADNVIIKQKIARLEEKDLELRKDFEEIRKTQQETRKDLERIEQIYARTDENLKDANAINSQVAEGCLRLEKKKEETTIAISQSIQEMKSTEAHLNRLQKITNDLLLSSKDQDLPEEIKEEKKNADEFLGDVSGANDLPVQNPAGDHPKVASLEMQELIATAKVKDESQDEAINVKKHEDNSIKEENFEDKSPNKAKEIIEQLPTKNTTDFTLNDIVEKKEELSDLPKVEQQQNQIIEEFPKLSVFPELFPSETHIEEIVNPQSNIPNNLKNATLLNSASSITQAALPHSVRQTTISNKEIKLSTPIPSVPTPTISHTQKQAVPINHEKINSTDPLKIKNQKIIPQKLISKNIFQRTCLLFFNLMVNIFYRWPKILLQRLIKPKI